VAYNDRTGAIYTINSKQLDRAGGCEDNARSDRQFKEREQRVPLVEVKTTMATDVFLVLVRGALSVP